MKLLLSIINSFKIYIIFLIIAVIIGFITTSAIGFFVFFGELLGFTLFIIGREIVKSIKNK